MRHLPGSLMKTTLLLAVLATASCVGEEMAGRGALELSVSGGAAVRDGFPHMEGEHLISFVDGWGLSFDTYVVAVGGVVLTDPRDSRVKGEWVGPKVIDLAQSAGATEPLATLRDLPARRLDLAFDFVVPPASLPPGSADPDDVALMHDNGWALLVAGEAWRGDESVEFRFGLAAAARYTECINGKDRTRGIAIEADKTIGAFIYTHAIHLFWDSLGAGNTKLRFDALAAVQADGVVTEEELKRQDLTDLRDGEGRPLLDESGYPLYDDAGLLPFDRLTLLDFITHAARAGVHFNGIGLCRTSPL